MRSDVPADSTADEVEAAVAAAHRAQLAFRTSSAGARAEVLAAVADRVEAAGDALVETAARETGLSVPRLRGELRLNVLNLRIMAQWVGAHGTADSRVDAATDAHPVGPHPSMRSTRVPVGVALNFAASNFPLAFSVAGVDTAAALAAGCAVIVKAHPGHPMTSAIAFEALRAGAGLFDPQIVQLIFGEEAGVQALRDHRVKVATFTGSLRGGRALAAIAASRPDPIPFYGELGSINPVVITPEALAARPDELAAQLVEVIADSAGQVCTKPGLVFVPRDAAFDAAVGAAAATIPEHRMLYPGLARGYLAGRKRALDVPGARLVVEGHDRDDAEGQTWVTPTVLRLDLHSALEAGEVVGDEVFGPFTVLVGYDDLDELADALPRLVPGSLTASVLTGGTGDTAAAPLIGELGFVAGRVIRDDWPMAVHITPTQHHGGPFPATTLDVPDATSVGQAGIARFQRTVTWQGPVPDPAVPALRNMPKAGESLR